MKIFYLKTMVLSILTLVLSSCNNHNNEVVNRSYELNNFSKEDLVLIKELKQITDAKAFKLNTQLNKIRNFQPFHDSIIHNSYQFEFSNDGKLNNYHLLNVNGEKMYHIQKKLDTIIYSVRENSTNRIFKVYTNKRNRVGVNEYNKDGKLVRGFYQLLGTKHKLK